MVIVPMPFESNAGVASWSAEERPSMRNRLLVLGNGLQETARRRRKSPASAQPSNGPITGIPCVRAVGPCDLLREKKIWGPSTFSSAAIERFRVLRPVARVQIFSPPSNGRQITCARQFENRPFGLSPLEGKKELSMLFGHFSNDILNQGFPGTGQGLHRDRFHCHALKATAELNFKANRRVFYAQTYESPTD